MQHLDSSLWAHITGGSYSLVSRNAAHTRRLTTPEAGRFHDINLRNHYVLAKRFVPEMETGAAGIALASMAWAHWHSLTFRIAGDLL